jgi:hypothetical protein
MPVSLPWRVRRDALYVPAGAGFGSSPRFGAPMTAIDDEKARRARLS